MLHQVHEESVLIADDIADMRQLLTHILLKNGFHHIYQTASGAQTLRLIDSRRIDLAFLDINMPDISGLEILHTLKETWPDAFCIMMSASSTMDNVSQAREAGANTFIVKPFTRIRVEQALRLWFADRQQLSGSLSHQGAG